MENPPSEYVPTNGQPPAPQPAQPQFLPPQPPAAQFLPPQPTQPPVPPQGAAPQFPGGGGEAPYRAYAPASRRTNWTLAIVGLVLAVLAIPALFLFIGIFSWAMR